MDERKYYFRSPKIQTVLVVLVGILLYIYLTIQADQWPSFLDYLRAAFYTVTFRFERIPANVQGLFLDIMLFLSGLFIWMAFFAQFILPVRSVQDRYAALDRLLVYFMGAHGPAIFVQDGVKRQRWKEHERRGPGLIYLDSASAAVLRDDVSFTRPVGPGVVFTPKGEYLASAVDLHVQSHPRPPFGPLPDEDPFAPRGMDEPDANFAERTTRRLQTSAMTRDGVEIVPNITASFMIEPLEDTGFLGFSYNPDAVLRYVTAEGAQDSSNHPGGTGHVPVNLLPANLAVELWREYLQKFTLNQLFSLPGSGDVQSRDTALNIIRRMVFLRLTQPLVEELNDSGQPTGRTVRSREYEILKNAGIRVLRVAIYQLRMQKSIEATMVQQWMATWLQRAQLEREQVESTRSRAVQMAKEDGLLHFARAAINLFDEDLLSSPRPDDPEAQFAQMRWSLENLINGTRNDLTSNPVLTRRLVHEHLLLDDLLEWIKGVPQ